MTKVLNVILLKPYFFSITKESYQVKGILMRSDVNPIMPKNNNEINTELVNIFPAKSSINANPPEIIKKIMILKSP